MQTKFSRLRANRRGATAVEYALIVALIALAAAGGISVVGDSVLIIWNHIVNGM
jgi:Flp pilus assembly pilin Flp